MKTMLIKCVQENPRSDYVRKPDKPTARPVGQHKDVRVHYRPNGAIRLFDESHISDACIQRVSANVIQRVFNPDRPETWIRPNFRERLKEDLWDRQVELCSLTQEYFNPVSGKMEISLQTICPVCGEPMSFQGCSIDHIRNWRAYAKEIWKVRDEEQLKKLLCPAV